MSSLAAAVDEGKETADSTEESVEAASDSLKEQAQQAKQGGQGLMGWAYKTASNTMGKGLQLTEATVVGTARGVSRTAGSAVNVASRAGKPAMPFQFKLLVNRNLLKSGSPALLICES